VDWFTLCLAQLILALTPVWEVLRPFAGTEIASHSAGFLRALAIAMLGIFVQRFVMRASGDLAPADRPRQQKRRALDLILAALSIQFAFVVAFGTERMLPDYFPKETVTATHPTFVLVAFAAACTALWANAATQPPREDNGLIVNDNQSILNSIIATVRFSRTGLARFSLLFAAWL